MRPDEREVAGLTCAQVMAALSDYAEGEVPADLRARIEAHVAGCRQCERFGAGFVALLAGMRRQLATPDPVDDDMVARLRRVVATSVV
ncbi:MAG: zf-HC2 domain-containing protein [Acidobacteria bacterium]|nr:zf-HC2 domain-containing protein [Acidobacteriota bacterium]